MKQNPSHSNTPVFGVNKSQTTQILYQQPTKANTVKYKSKSGLVGISIAIIVSVFFLKACSDDVERNQEISKGFVEVFK